MPLYLTDDQRLLRDTAREFMAAEGNVGSQLRHWRDRNCKDGFGHALWKQFGEMGFTGVLVPESAGGLGLGAVEAGIVAEEIGRELTPSPYLSTAVGAAVAFRDGEAGARWLPGILAGETVAAIAVDEGPKHAPERIETRAEPHGNGVRLTGTKQFVVQGASADVLIVAARGEDGVGLYAVEKAAAGLDLEPTRLVDSSVAATVRLEGAEAEPLGGADLFGRVLAHLRLGAAWEQVGVGTRAAEMTANYLKERRQFGRLIGEFQALQHRAAHLHSELEIARAAALKAAQLLDEGARDAELMISVAKAKCARVGALAVQEGVQMFGGVGMTDEYDIGLYMKRDRALTEWWGDARYHTERVASLSGY